MSWAECDDFLFASEIAFESMLQQSAPSLDEILCDPVLAAEFDELAARFAPGYRPFEYRWGALKLRKQAKVARSRGAVLNIPAKLQSPILLDDSSRSGQRQIEELSDSPGSLPRDRRWRRGSLHRRDGLPQEACFCQFPATAAPGMDEPGANPAFFPANLRGRFAVITDAGVAKLPLAEICDQVQSSRIARRRINSCRENSLLSAVGASGSPSPEPSPPGLESAILTHHDNQSCR